MKNLYRFRSRTGRPIEVLFRHMPGKWMSTGKRTMAEAVIFAEDYLKNDGIIQNKAPDMTLRKFASGFFSKKDPQGIRRLNGKRHEDYPENYYSNFAVV